MEEEILKILEKNPTLSNREIGKILGKSRSGIQYYLNKMNIHRDRKVQQKFNNNCREKVLIITDNAEQIILGSILGDGSVAKYRRTESSKKLLNSFLCINHSIKQEGYIKYKKELLEKEGVKCYLQLRKSYKVHYIKGKEVKENGTLTLKTVRNVSFNQYRDMFYNNRKYVNIAINKLNPLGLAIWFMDDGNGSNGSFHLYTNGFSIEDDQILVDMLKNNFKLDTTLQKTSNIGRCIYIKANSRKRFVKLIQPYVCDAMRYKIGT